MAGLTDFGTSPITTAFNFLFGGSLSDTGPNNVNNGVFDKNIFDDVIGGLDSYFDCKDEFPNLPTPSLTTTDDFLDTILRDLDVVEQIKHEDQDCQQQQSEIQQNFPHIQQQQCSNFAFNDIPHQQCAEHHEQWNPKIEKFDNFSQFQNLGHQSSSSVTTMNNNYHFTAAHAGFSQNQHQMLNVVDDCFKDAKTFFTNNDNDDVIALDDVMDHRKFNSPMNFISENNLPPLAETIEVELTQEHSYAAAVSTTTSTVSSADSSSSPSSSVLSTLLTSSASYQQHSQQNQQFPTFVSQQQHDSGVSSGAQSPFSSSGSMRSSFSSSTDTVDHLNIPLYSNNVGGGGGKIPSYRNNASRSSSNYSARHHTYNQNHGKSDDVNIDIIEEALKSIKDDDRDEDFDYESDFDQNFGQSPPPISTNSFFKPKFKAKSPHHILPYTKKDIKYDEKYPTLFLSDEEKILCEKEGVKLPSKFPLTKQEERDLRRIRRKIRNKRSAQESRRKKHEYISSLEDRVRACDDDNQSLRRQVEMLSKNNRSLVEQLKKLQSTVSNGATRPAVQAGTCLAVLLLSFALLVAPNYNLFGKKKFSNGSMSDSSGGGSQSGGGVGGSADVSSNRVLVPGNTRTLMQATNLDDDEMSDVDDSLPSVDGALLLNVSGEDSRRRSATLQFGANSHFGASSDGGGGGEIKPLDGVLDVGDNVSMESWYVRSGGGGPENYQNSKGSILSAKIYDKMERMIRYGHHPPDEFETTPDPKRKKFWTPVSSVGNKRFKAEVKQELPNFGHIQVTTVPTIVGVGDSNKSRNLVVRNDGIGANVITAGGESYYDGIGSKTTSVYINRRQIKVEEF